MSVPWHAWHATQASQRHIQARKVLAGSRLRDGNAVYFVQRVQLDYVSDEITFDMMPSNGAFTHSYKFHGSALVELW